MLRSVAHTSSKHNCECLLMHIEAFEIIPVSCSTCFLHCVVLAPQDMLLFPSNSALNSLNSVFGLRVHLVSLLVPLVYKILLLSSSFHFH